MPKNKAEKRNERVLEAAVQTLRLKLLDLTGRNQLLSFKHSDRSRKHVRVIDATIDVLVEQLGEGADFRFHPLSKPSEEPPDERTSQFQRLLERSIATDSQYREELRELGDNPPERALANVERALRDRLRAQQSMPERPLSIKESSTRSESAKAMGLDPSFELSRQRSNEQNGRRSRRLQTLLYPDELERKLRGIYEQARSSIEERGVNTLFAAIGFLEWYETDTDSASALYAPLLLFPVELKRELDKSQYVYSVVASGDEPSENLPLRERLRQDFDLLLPAFDPEQHSAESYLRKVKSTIQSKLHWNLRRYLTIGHFEFTKLPMYHDLDPANWQRDGTGLVDKPILASILGGSTRQDAPLIAQEYSVDEPPIVNDLPHLITDADSSQLSAIDPKPGKYASHKLRERFAVWSSAAA